jgi:hypothetical protein
VFYMHRDVAGMIVGIERDNEGAALLAAGEL